MTKPSFVHLHNHSEYSLLDGIIRFEDRYGGPSEFLRDLARNGAGAMTLTDHGNMYGAVDFYRQCREVGLKPIVGLEAYVAPASRADRDRPQHENRHLTLLARDFQGYQNLMELSTKSFMEGYHYEPRIDLELLAQHAKGLIVLSGCLRGDLARAALKGDAEECARLAVSYRDMLEPDCYYLELMDHGLPEQKEVIKILLEVSRRTGIPVVATNDCHMERKEDAEARDARSCIAYGQRLDDKGRPRNKTAEAWFKSPEEMAALFSYAPEAVANTARIAEMCGLEIPMGKTAPPQADVPAGLTDDGYLEALCRTGLQDRFEGQVPKEHTERLDYELAVIRRLDLSGFFLVVKDLVDSARAQGVPVGPGRGAAPGSLAAYALGVTGLDPIKHGLLFERFITPERKSLPDLAIDFGDTGRDLIIDHARRKHGGDRVSNVITFGSFGAKLALRDTGRVLGVPMEELDRLVELVPTIPWTGLQDAIRTVPELAEAAKGPRYRKLTRIALKLDGLKRSLGTHSASVVIAGEPITRRAPLCRMAGNAVMTQYAPYALMDLGLFQIDLLSLRVLSVMEDAVKAIRSLGKLDFSLDAIPLDDPRTLQLMAEGQTDGVFQLNSKGLQELLKRLKPSTFEDVVAAIALYRPGPIQAGIVDSFIARKHNRRKISYPHPLTKEILKDTYGCILYQEQIMRISKKLAGFTPGEADQLRKGIAKRIPETITKLRERFLKGCAANGIGQKVAGEVYDWMEKFGGYGFNKSHAAAYGLVAYQTAYLKANHPVEYMAALVTNESHPEAEAGRAG